MHNSSHLAGYQRITIYEASRMQRSILHELVSTSSMSLKWYFHLSLLWAHSSAMHYLIFLAEFGSSTYFNLIQFKTLDSSLYFNSHISSITKPAFFPLRNIAHYHSTFSVCVAKTLVHAFITALLCLLLFHHIP